MDNVVVGHLCQDPILRQPSRGGRPVARFTVAVNVWRRIGSDFVERPAVFHRVVCFGQLAENVSNSLRKGMEVLALGEWVDDSYSDDQGQRRVHVAMEARTVGPTLRRATVLVHKIERRLDVDPLTDGSTITEPSAAIGMDPAPARRERALVDPDTPNPMPAERAPADRGSADSLAVAAIGPIGAGRRGGTRRHREPETEPAIARAG